MNVDRGHLLLKHEDMQLILDAAHGGAVRDFRWRDRPIFRPTLLDPDIDPFQLGCFPMVPYANRISHGRFNFGANTVQLRNNCSGEPHPLHGQGWRSPWSVVAATSSSALLMFEGGADEWPWRYRARQHFQLYQNELSVNLSIQNLARSAMPVMLGLHPCFYDARLALLQASTPRVWLVDDASRPSEKIATPPDWSFDRGRSITAIPLDHCFENWNGGAVISWPDRKVYMRATNCRYLHVYAPAGSDLFCVEPLSAAAGALDRDQYETTLVQSGAHFEIHVTFHVEDSLHIEKRYPADRVAALSVGGNKMMMPACRR